MDRVFKCHCSDIHKIMGRMGLTDKQLAYMNELSQRKISGPKLTAKMEADLVSLELAHANPELPATATTFLKEWYANDEEIIFSKYLDKGNAVEDELLDFMAVQLGFGLAVKNTEQLEDDYFIGTCDTTYPRIIVDVKAPWSNTTLHDSTQCADPGYIYQGRGYMRLWDKDEFILFHGLMNTPGEINYDREVTYDHIPASQRWVAYKVKRDLKIEQEMVERVKLCRTWLEGYDKLVKSRLGKLHEV